MKLTELQDEWDKDAHINTTEIATEADRTHKLHTKYLRIYADKRLLNRRLQSEWLRLRAIKTRYYKGEMTQAELLTHGWSQFLGRKPLMKELEAYLKSDDELIVIEEKIEYVETIIDYLQSIMGAIKSRTWDVKTALEDVKMKAGL